MNQDNGLFKTLFGREPKKESDEPDFSRTVSALRTALKRMTPDHPDVVSERLETEDEGPEVL